MPPAALMTVWRESIEVARTLRQEVNPGERISVDLAVKFWFLLPTEIMAAVEPRGDDEAAGSRLLLHRLGYTPDDTDRWKRAQAKLRKIRQRHA